MKEKKRKKKRVIPGFGLSFGITIAMLGFIVVIPLCTLVIFSAKLSFTEFITTVTRPRVLSSYRVSLETALIAALIDAVMGTILAWVLVRYNFPGKQIMNGIIELPFALPTAVAGIALTHLTTTNGWLGAFFAKFGIKIAYTRLGIIFALIFVGIPFVVRAVQPVLEKVDIQYEEAANMLGATNRQTVFRVILPEMLMNFLLCGILFCLMKKKNLRNGRLMGIYLIYYSIARFLLEMLRGDKIRGSISIFSTSQLISLILLPVGIVLVRGKWVEKHCKEEKSGV